MKSDLERYHQTALYLYVAGRQAAKDMPDHQGTADYGPIAKLSMKNGDYQ